MHRLRNMACVRGIGPYQLGLRRDRGVRLVAPTAQRLRRDPQILGDLFDRLGLRRIRAARLGQQPDGLRLELRRVSRSFCHGSPSSPIELGEMRNKNQFISPHIPSQERLFLRDISCESEVGGRKAARQYACVVGGHHGTPPDKSKIDEEKNRKTNVGLDSEAWISVQDKLIDFVADMS